MSIGIIDYGACNILSVYNSLYRLGEDPIIIKDPKLLSNCDLFINVLNNITSAVFIIDSDLNITELNDPTNVLFHKKEPQ